MSPHERSLDRRTVLRVAAWSVPVVAVAVASPVIAATVTGPTVTISLGPASGAFRQLFAQVQDATGPVGGVQVVTEVFFAGGWTELAMTQTDSNGSTTVNVYASQAFTTYRAYVTINGVRYTSTEIPNA